MRRFVGVALGVAVIALAQSCKQSSSDGDVPPSGGGVPGVPDAPGAPETPDPPGNTPQAPDAPDAPDTPQRPGGDAEDPDGTACSCDGRECGFDGCTASCGECDGDDVCNAGICVAGCTPSCSDAACGRADSCGGLCPPCPGDVNCTDCALKLTVVERDLEGDEDVVTLALDLVTDSSARPTLADLRFELIGASLDGVALGRTLIDADKELLVDHATGKPYRALPDGRVQVIVYSGNNNNPFDTGRMLFLRLAVTDPAAASIALVPRTETFAPHAADEVLWGGGFEQPIYLSSQRGSL